MTDKVWTFDWGRVRGEVSALGGMLGPVWFSLADGRDVQPFAVAPWADDPAAQLETLPPILRRLRGEFPCVPFGSPVTRTDLPKHWMDGVDPTGAPNDGSPHGFSANHNWHLVERTDTTITIAINYPEGHVVHRLERRMSLDDDLGINIDLQIEMRSDSILPVGLHPIFALPDQVGAGSLSIPSLQSLRSFPMPVENASVFAPDQVAASFQKIRLNDGALVDVSRLPLSMPTEELLAVTLTDGHVRFENTQDSYIVNLNWDISVFPQCLLWMSNRGRDAYPWNGEFSAIGIEPVASAFDLGTAHSANRQSPVGHTGTATGITLVASTPFKTTYRIGLAPLSSWPTSINPRI